MTTEPRLRTISTTSRNRTNWTSGLILRRMLERERAGLSLKSSVVQRDDMNLAAAARRHFGSWKQAVAKAHEMANVRVAGHTRESIIAMLRKHAAAGQPVSTMHPSLRNCRRVVTRLFGSWAAAAKAAGVKTPARPPRRPQGRWTKDAVIAGILERKRQNLSTNHDDVRWESLSLFNAARRFFGSWRAGCQAAELSLVESRTLCYKKENQCDRETGIVENQNIDWKEKWRDEYLEWVCGFANAQGGILEIGRNNSGEVVGLAGAAKLLEMLPNKIRTTMGIIADVNLCHESGKEYIAIKVAAHHNAISYRGKYYYRTGSTNQELTGYSLDELLLGKYGKTWDAVPVPRIKADDCSHDAFDAFRKKAATSKRLLPEDVNVGDPELLEALKLTGGEYLLRAALLLFHRDPDKWCIGSYVKIGYFENDADLLYQDESNGPLITVPDRVMDIIFTKYFKGLIRYAGIQRIDEYPMPRDVLREAVLNAVVHKDYSTGNPVHIKVYDDKVIIYNDCQLPANVP